MLRGAKNTVQGAKMAFGTPFLATPFGVALSISSVTPTGVLDKHKSVKYKFCNSYESLG